MKLTANIAMTCFLALGTISFGRASVYETAPPDTQECKKQYSIVQEYMKQKNYELAAPGWRYVYTNCPERYNGMYIFGYDLIKNYYMPKAGSDAAKSLYVDSLMMLHDRRIVLSETNPQKFGSKGDNIGKKAMDMIQYRKDSTSLIYAMLKESVTLQGKNTKPNVASFYMAYANKLRIEKKLECGDIVNIYSELMDICDNGFAATKDSNYVKAQTNIEKQAEKCLDCSALLDSYGKNFEANKGNIEWLKKASFNLDKKDCSEKEEFKTREVIGSIFKAYAELSQTSDAFSKLGKYLVSINKKSEALEYFKKAAELETDNEKKAKNYLFIASLQAEAKDYSDARATAKKAASLKPNWGDPFILIGDMYAATSCGDDACSKGGPLWAAADKYNYAKSIDPACAEKASQRVSRCVANYPSQEECFFLSIKDGDSYTVGCWIGEGTTVRTKK
jgi:tetratricopeptide (TPR) repeat protein